MIVENAIQLSEFVRQERDAILHDWEELVLRVPVARTLDRRALYDHLPWMLDRIADMIGDEARGQPVRSPAGDAHIHATERLEEGYDLETVVAEYAVLRECIFRRWQERKAEQSGLVALNRAIDQAVSASVTKFVSARERTLAALDRLTALSFQVTNLDAFLKHLADVVVQTVAAVDSLAVYLVEGAGTLRLAVAAGLEEDQAGKVAPLGESRFAGRVAKQESPLELLDAAQDESAPDVLRARKVRCIFGVPMMHGEELIGVACIASASAFRFTGDDKLLFHSMVDRGTSVVIETRLLQSERQARHEAERERAQLDALLLSAPVGIEMFDRELRFLRISRSLAGTNRLPIEQLIGHTIAETTPVFAGRFESELREMLHTGHPILNRELEIPAEGTPLGTRHWLATWYPVRDAKQAILGLGGVLMEITRQKEIEAELNRALRVADRSTEELRVLADSVPGMVWVADGAGRLEFANSFAIDYVGRPLDVLKKEPLFANLHPDDRGSAEEGFAQALRDAQPYEHSARLRRADGSYRHHLMRARPLLDSDRSAIRWFGTATDVDELSREELGARRQARFAQQLIGVASHDLRNPIAVVLMSAERLARRFPDQPDIQRASSMIITAARRATRLVHDLLDFTQAELRGELPINATEQDVFPMLEAAVEEARSVNPGRSIELRIAGDGHGQWDGERLVQVILNLLGNALKYSPEDRPVTVNLLGRRSEIQIQVHNRGPPLPPDEVDRLFAPMERGLNKESAERSVGLGLYIIQKIVHAHGGGVSVSSSEREGTTFTVKIPRA